MSDGYKELDLDSPGKTAAAETGNAADIEIVHEGLETPEVEIVQETPAPAKAAQPEADEDDDDDSSSEAPSSERKKLTRSQRLKAQRDAYARQLADAQSRLVALETRATRAEAEANEGAVIGFDLYIKQLDTSMQALRRDFDAAYDAGDRDKIFEIQQQIASITAAKAQAEKDRRTIPTKPTQQSGSDTPQQTSHRPAPKRTPSPAAMEWYERNKTWFNKDPVLTAGARVIDQQMVADGYAPTDPDYFEELDKRLKTEFPTKLGGRPATTTRQASNPTIQNRASPAATPGKIRVTITQSDREMANHLGISVEDYAREKARAERAQQTTSQYTEIF
jgi:hypothetical protein